MNPQFDQSPGLHLPEPSLDAKPVAPMVPVGPAQQPIQQPMMPQMPAQQPVQPVAPQPIAPQQTSQPTPVGQPQQSIQVAPQEATAPSTEQDIDQQWINKAKDAIQHFSMDPYAQSNALSKIKADYLQSRHSITTKLGGES
jgi:hypothetical protein